MNGYDFSNLSGMDFEILVQDLLQKEMGITFETFTSGSDSGIDLRHIQPNGEQIIVQCKNFSNTPYPTMMSQLRTSELQKVQTQHPARYIFATSAGLNPRKKNEIHDIFKPFCKSAADIYGKDDINNLLRKFPEVEKAHFKLWLSSTTVIEKITHSAVFNQTDAGIEKIRKKLNYYVQNESYFEAVEILEKEHYCIIAGIPGIGKTTLAEVVLISYLNNGYEGIEVMSDISEAFGIIDKSKKQIFLYDDFLGQTSIQEKLNKNEEQKLLRFIDTVRQSPNTKFILTTREYILNQAKQRYEKLDQSKVDINKCVISLDKYTKFNKAKILYNHLYFSNLPDEYVGNLLIDKKYKTIINHPNYTPRIIEGMTRNLDFNETKSHEYFEQFVANLDNPFKLWEHIFDNQLSIASQHLLLVLVSMPSETFIEDLESAFNIFYGESAKTRNFSTGKYDFKRSLKELESNFIRIERIHEKLVIDFHNPSVKDFIEYRLSVEPSTVKELCRSAIFFDQIVQFWNINVNDSKKGIKNFSGYDAKNEFTALQKIVLEKIEKTFQMQGCRLRRRYFNGADSFNLIREFFPEERFEFALDTAESIFMNDSKKLIDFIIPLTRIFIDLISQKKCRLREIYYLVGRLSKRAFSTIEVFEELVLAVRECLMINAWSLEDFGYFLGFKREFPKLIRLKDFKKMKERFLDKAKEEISFYKDEGNRSYNNVTADEIGAAIEEISTIAPQFGLNFGKDLKILEKIVDELENNEMYISSSANSQNDDNRETGNSEKDIEDLFNSLRDNL